MSTRIERLAWAAGLLEGDGTIAGNRRGGVSVHVGGTDVSLLLRFQEALQCGNVTGPYDRSADPRRWYRKPQFFFQVYAEGEQALEKLWFALGTLKRQQGRAALLKSRRASSMGGPMWTAMGLEGSPRLQLAWAAGFFDAEGCFSSTPRVGVCATITQTDREILERFKEAVGIGKIYGPYQSKATDGYARKPHYFFRAHGNERVQAVLAMLWPWLGTTNRQQAIDRLVWTTTCRNGHPKKPGHAGCGACTKAYWAARRSRGVSEPAVPYAA